jgi:hypothetical protein
MEGFRIESHAADPANNDFALVDGLLPDCWTKFGAIQISLLANFSFRRP